MTDTIHTASRGGGRKGLLAKGAAMGALAFALVASPASAQLDRALQEAKSSTAAAAAAQQQVDALGDRADAAERKYAATLQQADNLSLFVDRQRIYLESQKSDLDSLGRQIETVESVKQGVVPLMLEMVVDLEDSIRSDIPFRLASRLERIEDVKNAVTDPRVSPVDQYRRILNAYAIEANFGYQTEAYEGEHPSSPGNVVDFLRAGRTTWVYMTKDGSEVAVYDLASRSWTPVSSFNSTALRQAARVGYGRAGEEIVQLPMVKYTGAN